MVLEFCGIFSPPTEGKDKDPPTALAAQRFLRDCISCKVNISEVLCHDPSPTLNRITTHETLIAGVLQVLRSQLGHFVNTKLFVYAVKEINKEIFV